MEYLRRYWWLAIALVLAIGAYAYFNRPPSPINASAANLLVSSEDLSGWPVDLQSTDNTFGSSDAARGVVHPGADADVYVMVYVFRSTTDSRSGYQQAITQVQNAGWTAPGAEGNPVFGDESFIGWSPAGSMVALAYRECDRFGQRTRGARRRHHCHRVGGG